MGVGALLPGREAQAVRVSVDLCRLSNLIVVTTVVQREPSFWAPDGESQTILTPFELRVDSVAWGAPITSLRLPVEGGEVGQARLGWGESPRLQVGERWLFAFYETPGTGGLQLLEEVRLDPSLPVPSNAQARRWWEQLCAANPRGVPAGGWSPVGGRGGITAGLPPALARDAEPVALDWGGSPSGWWKSQAKGLAIPPSLEAEVREFLNSAATDPPAGD